MKLRLRDKLGLLLSQALNTLMHDGDPDESLSARAWREGQRSPAWAEACARIDSWLGAGHCKAVWQLQRQREQARAIPPP